MAITMVPTANRKPGVIGPKLQCNILNRIPNNTGIKPRVMTARGIKNFFLDIVLVQTGDDFFDSEAFCFGLVVLDQPVPQYPYSGFLDIFNIR